VSVDVLVSMLDLVALAQVMKVGPWVLQEYNRWKEARRVLDLGRTDLLSLRRFLRLGLVEAWD
jgi:hypothetical protein